MSNADPPDAFTPDCSWCGDDPRPTAFCCALCENESRLANEEPAVEERAGDSSYERDSAFLARREMAVWGGR